MQASATPRRRVGLSPAAGEFNSGESGDGAQRLGGRGDAAVEPAAVLAGWVMGLDC